MAEKPMEERIEDAMIDMLARSEIQAIRNAVMVCGAHTGHVLEPIAFCNEEMTAKILADALKAYVAERDDVLEVSRRAQEQLGRAATGPLSTYGGKAPRVNTTLEPPNWPKAQKGLRQHLTGWWEPEKDT